MRKSLFKIFSSLLLAIVLFVVQAEGVFAAAAHCDIEIRDKNYKLLVPATSNRNIVIDEPGYTRQDIFKLSFYLSKDYPKTDEYSIGLRSGNYQSSYYGELKDEGSFYRYEADLRNLSLSDNANYYLAQRNSGGGWVEDTCPSVTIKLADATGTCTIGPISANNTNISFDVNTTDFKSGKQYVVEITPPDNITLPPAFAGNPNQKVKSFNITHRVVPSDKVYTLSVKLPGQLGTSVLLCQQSFKISPTSDPVITEPGPNQSGDEKIPFELCNQVWNRSKYDTQGEDPNFGLCTTCFQKEGVWTAVGCINYTDPIQTIRSFIVLGLGIGGGVVVLATLAGAFMLSTSQGDPKRVDEAKSLISSAIIGLLFIIFSITILRFIGVRVLRIPGFGG